MAQLTPEARELVMDHLKKMEEKNNPNKFYMDELGRVEAFIDIIIKLNCTRGLGKRSLSQVIEEYTATIYPYIINEVINVLYKKEKDTKEKRDELYLALMDVKNDKGNPLYTDVEKNTIIDSIIHLL